MERVTVTALTSRKGGEKIVMVTAYDTPTAQVCDAAGIDVVLVGDSLGTAVLGYPTTLPVTLSDLLHHTAAVARGSARALVVADLPFLSYGISIEESVRSAGRCLQEAGAQAVKLEGGEAIAPHVARMVELGIPVMGHIGLTPQSVHKFGGMKVQARTGAGAEKLLADALALERAGAFAIVLEAIPARLAEEVTGKVGIPTIGIGAGVGCDGQVLVFHDLVGWSPPDFKPRFVKRYADVRTVMTEAIRRYADEVRTGSYPGPEHSYGSDA